VPESPRPVVLSLGGSVLIQGHEDATYLSELSALLRRVCTVRRIVVVVGGGRTAREYIRLGRSLHLTEGELDELGIDVTRLHARLLAFLVAPEAPLPVPTTVSEAVSRLQHFRLVILGGTEPGHTTDAVAGMVAERLRAARLVNATSSGGIYERDPKRDPKARRFEVLSFEDFLDLVRAGAKDEAGQEFVFDLLGAQLIARARIPLAVVNGRDLAQLQAALEGRPFEGTRVGGPPDGGK